MSLLLAWFAFPLVLLAVSVGSGLLVDRLAGGDTDRALIAPLGFAAVVVVASLLTMEGATARFATPACVVAAIAGFASNHRRLTESRLPWPAVIAAAAVFLVYGAPVVLSGHPTFAGFIKLDDTATWMALTDRVMSHGRDISGLAPSSYWATLPYTITHGYPIGSLLPLGIGRALVGQDLAWIFQPYLALCASLIAMCTWSLLRPVIENRALRAVAVFIVSQPALLFAYSLWGGVKEMTGAVCVLLTAALIPRLLNQPQPALRRILPVMVGAAAALDVLSAGGALWLVLAFAVATVLLWRRHGLRVTAVVFGWAAVVGALLALPALRTASYVTESSEGLRQQAASASPDPAAVAAALGNLGRPLRAAQVAGIWPAADFRTDPNTPALTWILIGVLVVAAVTGLVVALKRGAFGLVLFALTTGVGCLVITHYGSPWVDAKALATAATVLPLAAAASIPFFASRFGRVPAALIGGLLAVGVLWSNVLAYGAVNLGPYQQLRELQRIGHTFAGQGPALMTEYNPYGVRHFLRALDAEGASELRVRPVFLTSGGTLPKSGFADIDQIQLASLLEYRTLVLRRSPSGSRPPSSFKLASRGRWYDVWQRNRAAPAVIAHIGLGTPTRATGVASCSDVRKLARIAGRGGRLATVFRSPGELVDLNTLEHPRSWTDPAGADLLLKSPGDASGSIYVANPGRYSVWLGGSVRSRVEASIDGRPVGSERAQLNGTGQWTEIGAATLGPGRHQIKLRYSGPDAAPGSAGLAPPLGPLALNLEPDAAEPSYVPAADASSLCGKSLDWIEAVR